MQAIITKELLFSHCETLVKEGVRVTLESVHARFNHRGSKSTIRKFLLQWEASRPIPIIETPSLPVDVQKAILGAISQQVSTARADLGERLAEAQAQATALAQESENFEKERDEALRKLAESQSANSLLEGRVLQMEKEVADLNKQLGSEQNITQGVRQELARADLRLEGVPRLENELESIRSSLELERKERSVLESQLAAFRERSAAQEIRLKDILTREEQGIRKAEQHEQKLIAQLGSQTQELKELLVTLETERARAALLDGELRVANVALDAARQRVLDLSVIGSSPAAQQKTIRIG